MKKLGFVAMVVILGIAACTTAPQSQEGKMEIKNKADGALANAKAADPTLADRIRDSYGYAVFPSVGKGGLGVGGAFGRRILHEHGFFASYCRISSSLMIRTECEQGSAEKIRPIFLSVDSYQGMISLSFQRAGQNTFDEVLAQGQKENQRDDQSNEGGGHLQVI